MYSDYISGIKNATPPPTIQVAGGIVIENYIDFSII